MSVLKARIIAVLDTCNICDGSVSIVVIDSFSSSLGGILLLGGKTSSDSDGNSVPRKLSEIRSLVWEAHLRTSERVHLFALHQQSTFSKRA